MRQWGKYNKELVSRARIDLYLSEEILENWYNDDAQGAHRPRKYSNLAIEFCILIRTLFKLPYRQTEGMVQSLLLMLGMGEITVPSYSQINRRQGSCAINTKLGNLQGKERLVIAIDSTGLSIYTAGQWHQRKHGAKKAKWIKLHAAIDVATGQVIDYEISDSNYSDSKAAQDMFRSGNLAMHQQIEELLGDGAYDDKSLYSLLYERGIKPNIRVRSNAIMTQGSSPGSEWRDQQILRMLERKFKSPQLNRQEILRAIRLEAGYGKRALVENLFSRWKAIFGDKLQSRKMQNIKTEIAAKIALINQFKIC